MNRVRLALIVSVGLLPAAAAAAPDKPLSYNRDIRPILSDNCFGCHGPAADRKAGLRLDEPPPGKPTTDSGLPAIVPGRPQESELVARIRAADPDVVMPPPDSHKSLSAEQKDLLDRWIAAGAVYEPHWSFVPPQRPAVPAVRAVSWPRNDVDRFILARLEQEGLAASAEADRATLLRRVTLDLTGLPPTPAEVDAFLADASPDAYEKAVDRLLSSPHYGERMAVDWLDAARYADSNGYQVDRDRELWPWRDWVIRAFNANLPFDRFTTEQLAGDLLPNPTLDQRIATGFHRNHMLNEEGGVIAAEFLAEYTADRVETTAAVWLGQTFTCCRCHDHKYDPFTQRDFYALKAFFHNVPERGVGGYGQHIRINAPPFVRLPAPELEKQLAELTAAKQAAAAELAAITAASAIGLDAWAAELALAPPPAAPATTGTAAPPATPAAVLAAARKPAAQRTAAEKKQLLDHRASLGAAHREWTAAVADLTKRATAKETEIPTTLVMEEMPAPRDTFVLMRGAYDKPGEKVEAATPAVLPPLPAGQPRNRLGLAAWLVAPDHPLTARVAVNRFWQQLFGSGIVKTSEDFGSQGSLPSHPELLDWLAVEFRETGWDVKRFMRLLVTSAAYRQRATASPALLERDPENRLLARGPRFRLPGESIRDQALATSGLLVTTVGGPSVRPYHPPGMYEQLTAGGTTNSYREDQGDALHRRSLYTYWKRSVPHPSLLLFDVPFRETCALRRPRSNTPLQALNLLNDPTYVEAARFLAQRMLKEADGTPDARLTHGFRLVLARLPADVELAVLRRAHERAAADFAADPAAAKALLAVGRKPADAGLDPVELAAYATVASTILNLDETVTKP